MELKNIKEFIEQFIKSEYEFNFAEYNMEVSDAECEEIAKKVNALIYDSKYERATSIEERKGNEQWEQRYKKKLEKIIPRALFQIKHYQNSILGDALKRVVTGNDLYACYVGYHLNVERDLFFSSIFYVSETNEGLKIIYSKMFNDEKGIWYHSHDLEAAQVLNPGKLIEVEKYLSPVETTSLADYNAE
jgi:hypothetical protein